MIQNLITRRHSVVWFLRRGVPEPFGVIYHHADSGDASCLHAGPWGNAEFSPKSDVCNASLWIQKQGASQLWHGEDECHLTDSPINIFWDFADWIWWYAVELPAATPGLEDVIADLGGWEDPELSVPGETLSQ